MATATLAVKIVGDASNAKKAFRETETAAHQTESALDRMSEGMKKAAVPATIATTGLVAMGKSALDAASALQQTTGAVEAVFKASSSQVEKLASTSAERLGLAGSKYREFATLIGAQLKGTGVSTKALAGETDKLIVMGADLAATFGGTTADAVSALSGVLKGETDPIERYGISIKASDIAAQKAAMGMGKLSGAADKAATRQAALALLTAQTKDSVGAFAREADTAAGAQERANAKWDDARAKLGTALLPIATKVSGALAGMADWLGKNQGTAQALALIVGTLALAVLAFNGGVAATNAIVGIATGLQWAWNAAMAANPIGLIVLGITALIATIAIVATHWDLFKQTATDAWNGVVAGATWLKDQVIGIFNFLWDSAKKPFTDFTAFIAHGIDGIVGWFRAIPDRIAGWFNGIQLPQWVYDVKSWIGFSAGGVVGGPDGGLLTAASSPWPTGGRLTTPPRLGSKSATPSISVQVSGAIDPQAVARQIRDILNSDARTRGIVTTTGTVLR